MNIYNMGVAEVARAVVGVVPFWGAVVEYLPVNGLSLFIWENNLRPLQNWIENQLYNILIYV